MKTGRGAALLETLEVVFMEQSHSEHSLGPSATPFDVFLLIFSVLLFAATVFLPNF